MIGLVYLLFLVLYLLISAYVIYRAMLYAQNKYNKGWIGGWLAAFLMYNLVFWDWIPVYVMHKYYCSTEAGFWVYKTPEQWIKENSETVGQKWGDDYGWKLERISNEQWRTWYSNRVYAESIRHPNFAHGLRKYEQSLVDSKSGHLLARVVQFEKINESALSVGNATATDYKIWLAIGGNSCVNEDGDDYQLMLARNFRNLIKLGQGTQE